MSLQQIFYLIGTIYFGLWLLITIGFIVFAVTFTRQMKNKFGQIEHQFEDKVKTAKVLMDLAQSKLVRKGLLFVGGISFVSKIVGSVLSGQDEQQS
jgi:hypothetical protein